MFQVFYDTISDAAAPAVFAVFAVVRKVGFVSLTSVCFNFPRIQFFLFHFTVPLVICDVFEHLFFYPVYRICGVTC